MTVLRRTILLAASLCAFAMHASAQSWPTRAVRIVVPFAVGSPGTELEFAL